MRGLTSRRSVFCTSDFTLASLVSRRYVVEEGDEWHEVTYVTAVQAERDTAALFRHGWVRVRCKCRWWVCGTVLKLKGLKVGVGLGKRVSRDGFWRVWETLADGFILVGSALWWYKQLYCSLS